MRLAPLLLVAVAGTARAQPTPPQELPYEVRDHAITGVGMLLYVLGTRAFPDVAPDACRWCDPPAFDESVRDGLRWDRTDTADRLSTWIGYAGLPLAAYGSLAFASGRERRIEQWWVDGLIVLQAAVLTMDVTYAIKLAVGRERPYVHALPDADKPRTAEPDENNLAFPSGHTTFAFSLATAAGVVATQRGYRAAPLVWAVGMPLAAATAYLRIAADRHWLSDTVSGTALGIAAGYAVPRLLHAPRRGTRRSFEILPTLGGLAAVGTF